MTRWLRLPALPVVALLAIVLAATASGVFADNIDPANDNSRFAWGENVGWVNAKPNGGGGPGVTVTSSALTGYMWGENAGWISMNCSNTSTCGSQSYGVTNNGSGVLAGYAWGENVGWISFSCANTGTCGSQSYGVTINTSTGVFSGQAWGENIGWITFNCATTGTCGGVQYQVRTSWPVGQTNCTVNSQADTDCDGCPDAREQQTAAGSQTTGGRRDYTNFWDYPDTPDGSNVRDHKIRIEDVTRVISRYNTNDNNGTATINRYSDPLALPPPTGYSPAFDHTYIGPNPWNLGPPDGKIKIEDVIAVINQYRNDCV